MPTNRKIVFGNNEYYHVFNRGVEKRHTFTNRREFLRAIDAINFYKFHELPMRYSKYLELEQQKRADFLKSLEDGEVQVEIIAFCLMPNHFHFLLKQIKDNGIVKFMAKFTNSYTKYFNTKHERVGPLFQGVFKAVHVESDEQLLHLSRYIHLNPVVGFIVKPEDIANYQWSSYPEYLELLDSKMVNSKDILSFFKSKGDYEKFVLDQSVYSIQLKMIDHLLID